MKIQELRDLISKAQRGQVEKAFAECYKQLSKQKKEEADVVIQDIFIWPFPEDKAEGRTGGTIPKAVAGVKYEALWSCPIFVGYGFFITFVCLIVLSYWLCLS